MKNEFRNWGTVNGNPSITTQKSQTRPVTHPTHHPILHFAILILTFSITPLRVHILLGCLVFGSFLSATAHSYADKPNVIVIYTDDQGYGDASCLNPDAKFDTPNLDRLAREGMTFTDAHCSDTVCTPSRYGLLTGRYSWRTELEERRVWGGKGMLDHRRTNHVGFDVARQRIRHRDGRQVAPWDGLSRRS